MTAHIPRLSGDEWQTWANRVLSQHYGPVEYQQVPDRDRGDAGIEGFTRTNGHAFQAYGCEEPITTAERYEKQRDKMTADIRKFIQNAAMLRRIFGTVTITRWALFVPICDSKELIVHAAKKTEEVKASRLSYVADTFQVCICQQSDFSVADNQLVNVGLRQLEISAPSRTAEQITEWAATNQGLSQILADKLTKVSKLTTTDDQKNFHAKVLNWYLRGQEILDALRAYPETYAKVKAAKSQREIFLFRNLISGRPPEDSLMESINELREELERNVKELHRFSSESLAFEAIADWLLRCPLDFPVVSHV